MLVINRNQTADAKPEANQMANPAANPTVVPAIVTVSGSITAYIASDLHYLSPKLHDDGEAYNIFANPRDGKEVRYIDEVVDAFIDEVAADKPELLILSGDLTCNGEKQSHIDLAEKLGRISDNTKVCVIPGNHDILNPYARGFEGDSQVLTPYISETEFKEIYNDFGYGDAISSDKESLSYLAKASDKLWLLMLDTCKYTNNFSRGYPQTGGGLGASTYKWINECSEMARAAGATLISVQHHNMIDHNESISDGFTIDSNQRLIDTYKDINVPLVFSGHIHCQEISVYDGIYDVASGAMCVLQNYGKLEFNGEKLKYSSKTVDVSSYAKKNNLTDENFSDYSQYAKNRFKNAFGSQRNSLGIAEENQEKVMETMKEMNYRYFAGEPLSDLANTEGYQIIIETEGFLSEYAKSMAKQDEVPNNSLEIEVAK